MSCNCQSQINRLEERLQAEYRYGAGLKEEKLQVDLQLSAKDRQIQAMQAEIKKLKAKKKAAPFETLSEVFFLREPTKAELRLSESIQELWSLAAAL